MSLLLQDKKGAFTECSLKGVSRGGKELMCMAWSCLKIEACKRNLREGIEKIVLQERQAHARGKDIMW